MNGYDTPEEEWDNTYQRPKLEYDQVAREWVLTANWRTMDILLLGAAVYLEDRKGLDPEARRIAAELYDRFDLGVDRVSELESGGL